MPGKNKAIVALVLGILSIVMCFPVLGIVGIVLANSAKKEGFTEGLQKAAFIVSIIGTALGAVTFACVACPLILALAGAGAEYATYLALLV